MGNLKDFTVEIGSFSQDPIQAFLDRKGNPCSYLEYLRDRRLYPSKSYIYLMTTALKDTDTSSSEHVSSEAEEPYTSMDDKKGSAPNEQAITGHIQNDKDNELKDVNQDPVNVYGVVLDGIDVSPSTHQIAIEYEELTESSYSEITIRSLSNSLQQCYWDKSLSDSFIRDEGFHNFCPLEHGFTVTAIRKGETCYLERVFSPPCEGSEESSSKFFFPSWDKSSDDIIIHHPLEIWGYDETRLILGVVTQLIEHSDVEYIWYRDGNIVKEGHNLCCIPVNQPGTYKVEVRVGDKTEVSKPIKVEPLRNLAAPPAQSKPKLVEPEASGSANSQHSLPFVETDQITFTSEIGRGSFGVVFKGVWSGTEVAIKDIQVRNAKRLKCVMENEVQVHTMARHPNITQIMAVSIQKNHIYIISEFVDGANLEDLLFGGNTNTETFMNKTIYIAKQVTQAVAYLHNLNPPIVHRDIKPANILVAKDSCVTKLCDMGLSRLKSATMQAVTATGVPGTPHYMAPECILVKKKSDLNSDIWSLACTLLELLTQKDCWEDLIEELGDIEEADDNYEVSCMLSIFRRKRVPKSLGLLASAISTSVQEILTDCFNYEPCERPRAIDLVNAF